MNMSSLIRWSVIELLLVAALAHIPVIAEHLREAPYMGVLFIGFTLTAFAVASALAAIPSGIWYVAAGALCAAAIVGYVATRLVAFPQLAGDVGHWTEPLGLLSVSSETVVAVLSLVAVQSGGLVRHAAELFATMQISAITERPRVGHPRRTTRVGHPGTCQPNRLRRSMSWLLDTHP